MFFYAAQVLKNNVFGGCPTVLEGLQTPTERFWPPLGPPPARPGPGPKIFSVGGPGGPEKLFSPRIFFVQKRYSLGPGWVLGPKKLILDPSRPPTRGHFGPFYTQNGQNGIQKRPKNAIFHYIFFAPNHFISVPTWSGTLKNPKLAS